MAIDVTSQLWRVSDLDSPVRLMDQVVAIGMRRQRETQQSRADIVVVPELEGYYNTDFSKIDSLVRIGYEAMQQHITLLSKLLDVHDTVLHRKRKSSAGPLGMQPGRDVSRRVDSTLAATQLPGPPGTRLLALKQALAASGYPFGSVSVDSATTRGYRHGPTREPSTA